MPYLPSGYDAYSLPNWYNIYPDRHPRWISMDSRRYKLHLMDYGRKTGYVPFGLGMSEAELKEAVEKIGLNDTYIDYARGRVVVGDVMLAWIPEEEWQRRVKERLANVQDSLDVPLERYLSSARSKYVTPRAFESEAEVDDYKKFATRDGSPRVGYTGAASR